MPTEEILSRTALNSWKLVIDSQLVKWLPGIGNCS
jgi:hypothetical protein